ncbi:MAG: hypothetical protein WBO08_02190 [Mycobacterium sp.]|nr:hypothetical protein [Mycobacterium sp.]
MKSLIAGQQWGLFESDVVAAKGGWGPDPAGNYLVRQFVVVPTDGGSVGVALAAEADDGSFASGIDAINSLAQWVNQHIAEFSGVPC